ncbi:hypothetical protein E2C01_082922 [Portunus trituberculatus]|uniref:Uncharacterized protein n=1 Tax=Portunus trituberculatus TaxID=210409 RepID=A0A5B7J0K2_PORTR|nr:hypothetical protein [Portunus trituberculatus]
MFCSHKRCSCLVFLRKGQVWRRAVDCTKASKALEQGSGGGAEYTPRDPSMWGSQPDPVPGTYYGSGPDRGPGSLTHRFSTPPPPLPPNTPRELISVPVNNGNHIMV